MTALAPPSPYFLEIPFAPPADYAARVAHLPYCLLLDSPATHGGRYAYLAFSPRHVLTEREGNIYIDNTIASEDVFTYLKNFQSRHVFTPLPSLPPFQTGWAGYIGYNYNTVQGSLNTSINDQPHPAVILCFYDIITAFDMQEQRAYVIAHPSVEDATVRLKETAYRFAEGHPLDSRLRGNDTRLQGLVLYQPKKISAISASELRRNGVGSSPMTDAENVAQPNSRNLMGLVLQPDISPAIYHTVVEKTLAYIRAGDIYQANIAQRFSATLPEKLHEDGAALFNVYQQISPRNPAPYSAFFHTPAVSLLSYSPEQFLHVEGNTITTRPIKGTAPRLQDALLDKKQQDLLLHSTKNRAENLMIVDLLRNDLSRVCVTGSVKVEKLYALESFSSVHHLVSTISGTLSGGNDAIDALRHAFPGGSITGAPKIRAMEIIHELEHYARNSYCGTLFYLGCDGCMESSILIRTLVVTAGKMTLHAGCGIVADSDPAAEYAESIAKARVFLDFFKS